MAEFADDLRSQALQAISDTLQLANEFPLGSPARRIFKTAAKHLKLHYIYTDSQKKGLVLMQISMGNRKISDMVDALGLKRPEINYLLGELLAAGYVAERQGKPETGPGRPARIFDLCPKADSWLATHTAEFFSLNW